MPADQTITASPTLDVTGYGLAIAGAALFSTKGIFIKLAYASGVGTETVLALRMLVALPFFVTIGLVALWRDAALRAKLSARRLAAIIAVGVLGYYVSSYLDFWGLAFVSAQYERLVLFTYPFIAFVLGVWLFGDRMVWQAIPALIVSYLGLLVVFVWSLTVNPQGLWVGTGLVLASATTYAFYMHLAKRQMNFVGPRLFTCIAMGAAGLVAITHNTLTHGIGQYTALSTEIWFYGIALGLLGTVFPAFLLNTAISRIGARASASTGAYGPIMTIMLAVWVLGEDFTLWHALGAALVVGGSILFGRAETRARLAVATDPA